MKRYLKIALTFVITVIFVTGIIMPEIIMGTPASPAVGNWYQQYLPNLNGAQITDITFTDSLTGFAVTSLRTAGDSAYILKTTNGGNSWDIKLLHEKGFVKVKFINATTGFTNAFTKIFKTTNAGENWTVINLPGIFGDDMFVLSKDTIWLAMSEIFTGGVFFTSTGGSSWINQFSLGSQNPEKIYMYNARIGYISKNQGSSGYVRKTTDGGSTWSLIVSNDYYTKIEFIDSLTGWKCSVFGMKKTTDGGLSWTSQPIPTGSNITSTFLNFTIVNKDTLWGCGGTILFPNNSLKSIFYRTVNGGNNWYFQIPDTAIIGTQYFHIQFVDKLKGWVYGNQPRGLHTVTGGDTNFILGINSNNSLPLSYKLHQNYPNPFNPVTYIRFEINKLSNVNLIIYDVRGKLIKQLINRAYSAGIYEEELNAANFSSGIYFYSMYINNKLIDTRKMVLLK